MQAILGSNDNLGYQAEHMDANAFPISPTIAVQTYESIILIVQNWQISKLIYMGRWWLIFFPFD